MRASLLPRRPAAHAAWWLPWAAVGALVLLLALQESRWPPLPAERTAPLWVSTLLGLGAAIGLASGCGDDERAAEEQAALGTDSNSFYAPRRRVLTEGGAVVGGIAGAIWWGASSWLVLGTGIQRGTAGRGLMALELAILAGAIAGSLIGALAGHLVGRAWEVRHRRERLKRRLQVVRGGRRRRGGGGHRRAS